MGGEEGGGGGETETNFGSQGCAAASSRQPKIGIFQLTHLMTKDGM